MASLAPGTVGSCRVAIVLVNFNGTIDTLKCLDSIRVIGSKICRTIVVDNGSAPDPSGEFMQAHPWSKVIRCEKNGGWSGGNNVGIRHALEHGAEWVLLLNNDTIVAPDIIDRLLAAAQHNSDHGILGPVICFMEDPDTVMTDGCRFNRPGFPGFFEQIPVPIALSGSPQLVSVDIVNGCCMMISRRVFERIGLIDERFFLIHEESDFCLRAKDAGFACAIVSEPLVWHKGSSTFKRSGKGVQRYYDARNLFLLLWKHLESQPGRRTALPSYFQYLKYIYYRFSIEREQGEEKAADAVLSGLCDALLGRFGPQRPPAKFALAASRLIFRITHTLCSMRPKNRGHANALSVRQA
jgi:GT2 family glycosyltransferase